MIAAQHSKDRNNHFFCNFQREKDVKMNNILWLVRTGDTAQVVKCYTVRAANLMQVLEILENYLDSNASSILKNWEYVGNEYTHPQAKTFDFVDEKATFCRNS